MNDKNDELLHELKKLNDDLKNIEAAKQTIQPVITPKIENNNSQTVQTTTSGVSSQIIPPFVLTNDNLSDFILKTTQEVINNGLLTINAIKNDVAATFDAKIMSGYAEIVNATTAAIETLNKINIEHHKSKTSKEIKVMDIEAKKQIVDKKKPSVTNNLTIVGGREEIMKMLKAEDPIEEVIVVEPVNN